MAAAERKSRFSGLADGVRRLLLFGLLLAPLPAAAGEDDPFALSPPAVAPSERPAAALRTNLHELRDAAGLALLLQEDAEAARLQTLAAPWEKDYAELLVADPELRAIDDQVRRHFHDNLAARGGANPGVAVLAGLRAEDVAPTVRLWLQSLLQNREVSFAADLDSRPAEDLGDICAQGRSFLTFRELPAWRQRVLLWRYRDSEVKRLHAARDEREAFLTPIALPRAELAPADERLLEQSLVRLRNLRLEVLRNREQPYEVFRTLDGLLRGLRYMDTIRTACAATGLDHRLMTRLFIQESEFVHHRVSSAGAYSLAQFLDIAVKDVWLFRERIPGSAELLAGVAGFEALKARILDDPRMAIRAACLYFRRVFDGIGRRLGGEGAEINPDLVGLLTLEMITLEGAVAQRAILDTAAALDAAWPEGVLTRQPLVPLALPVVPDPGSMLGRFLETTLRDLVEVSLSEAVARGRLERLKSAMGLAAYNAGTGNLMKAGKRSYPFGALSFPLQLTETRDYVDSILDGVDVLERLDRMVSEVGRMELPELRRLVERACRLVEARRTPPKPPLADGAP